MSFMNFLNKYKNVETQTEAPQAGDTGAVRGNRIAAQQQTEIGAMQTQEAQRLSSTEKLMRGDAKAKQFQSDQQIEGMRQESSARKQKFQMATSEISGNLKRDLSTISEQEKVDRMEAYTQAARLQNDKYVTSLEREGRMRRLSDAQEFDMALKEAVFSEELDLFRDNIQFQKLMDLDDAAFARQLSAMDINSAIALANAQTKSASQSMIYQGVGSMATSAAGWAAGREPTPETTKTDAYYAGGGA
jgi:hypothetical protein